MPSRCDTTSACGVCCDTQAHAASKDLGAPSPKESILGTHARHLRRREERQVLEASLLHRRGTRRQRGHDGDRQITERFDKNRRRQGPRAQGSHRCGRSTGCAGTRAPFRACVAPCAVSGGSNRRFAGVWAFQAALWLVSSTRSPWRTMKSGGHVLRRRRLSRHRLFLEAQDFTRVLTPSPGRLPRGIWAGPRFPGRNGRLPRHTSWWPGSEGSIRTGSVGSSEEWWRDRAARSLLDRLSRTSRVGL